MPQVSRYKLNQEAEEELRNQLELVLTKISKAEEMKFFLEALLTKTEKLMLAKRLALVVLLQEDLSDSKIAEALHLTRITVSKMRYFLESRGEGYEIALRKIAQEKDLQQLKILLLKFIRYSAKAAGGRI